MLQHANITLINEKLVIETNPEERPKELDFMGKTQLDKIKKWAKSTEYMHFASEEDQGSILEYAKLKWSNSGLYDHLHFKESIVKGINVCEAINIENGMVYYSNPRNNIESQDELIQKLATMIFSFAGKDSSDMVEAVKKGFIITRKK